MANTGRRDDERRERDLDDRLGDGRVVDKSRGTVYSPNRIDRMKETSDRTRPGKERLDR